jgi:tetratricopeptide (TPR) repeat protein
LKYLSDERQKDYLLTKFTEDFEKRLDQSNASDAYDYIKLADIVRDLTDDPENVKRLIEKASTETKTATMTAIIGVAYNKIGDEQTANEYFEKAFKMCSNAAELIAVAQFLLSKDIETAKVKDLYINHKSQISDGLELIGWIGGLIDLFGAYKFAEKQYNELSQKLPVGDKELLEFNKNVKLGREVF